MLRVRPCYNRKIKGKKRARNLENCIKEFKLLHYMSKLGLIAQMTCRTLKVLIFGYTLRNLDAFMVRIKTINNDLVNCRRTTNGCN
jgi:hypothetical protein